MMLLTMLSGMTLATAAEQGAGQEGTSELMGEKHTRHLTLNRQK